MGEAFALNIQGNTLKGFGKWEGSPVDWIILDDQPDTPDGRMLVFYNRPVAKMYRGRDKMEDGHEYLAVHAWKETTVIRNLNGDFLENAFTEEERERIADGADTGRVFVLSSEETKRFFPEKKDRAFGVEWMLRDVTKIDSYETDGWYIAQDGALATEEGIKTLAVLPAMWISRYGREERLARIRAWEADMLKKRDALKARKVELLDSLPAAEREQWNALKAVIARTEADFAAKRKDYEDKKEKRGRIWKDYICDKSALEESYKAYEKLNFFKFAQKKEVKAEIERLEAKKNEEKKRYDEMSSLEEAADDAKKTASEALESAKEAFDSFYNGLFGGAHLRIDKELNALSASIERIKKEYGIAPSANE